jgi:hypothetical protein
MNTTVITARKILSAWFSETNVRIALRATAKKSKNSCQHLPFSARGGMDKPSRQLPAHHHVPDVPQPVAKAVATDGKNA